SRRNQTLTTEKPDQKDCDDLPSNWYAAIPNCPGLNDTAGFVAFVLFCSQLTCTGQVGTEGNEVNEEYSSSLCLYHHSFFSPLIFLSSAFRNRMNQTGFWLWSSPDLCAVRKFEPFVIRMSADHTDPVNGHIRADPRLNSLAGSIH